MMQTRLPLIELGLLAVLGFTGSGLAIADPAPASRDEAELNYVYFRDDHNTTMSGNTSDIERARKFKQPNEQLAWFRDGGQQYVIRDPATLKLLDAAWTQVTEIGDAQGKVGKQQGELGSQQGEIGNQQGVIGTRQGTLAVREASLSMREANDSLTDAERAELSKQRHELRQQQRALGKQMRALDKPMKVLGERMQVLGKEMEELGQKMAVASRRATSETRLVFKRSIASGVAKPVK
jgi:hypothetical protein